MYEELIKTLRIYGLTNGTTLGRHMGIMDEAADALTALQSENAFHQEQFDKMTDRCAEVLNERDAVIAENAEKDKKIERLKIELRYKQDECDSHYGDFCEAKVDISRVEAERDAYKGRYLATTQNNVKLEAKLNVAVAFIQRIDREYGRYIVDDEFERWRGTQEEE